MQEIFITIMFSLIYLMYGVIFFVIIDVTLDKLYLPPKRFCRAYDLRSKAGGSIALWFLWIKYRYCQKTIKKVRSIESDYEELTEGNIYSVYEIHGSDETRKYYFVFDDSGSYAARRSTRFEDIESVPEEEFKLYGKI